MIKSLLKLYNVITENTEYLICIFYLLIFVMSGILELIAIALLIPLLQAILSDGNAFQIPEVFSGILVFDLDMNKGSATALVAFLFVIQAIMKMFSRFKLGRISSAVQSNLREHVVNNIKYINYEYFAKQNISSYINSMIFESYRVSNCYFVFLQWVASIITLIIYAAVTVYVVGYYSISAMVLIFIVMTPLMFLQKQAYKYGMNLTESGKGLQQSLSEYFRSIKTLLLRENSQPLIERIYKSSKKLSESWFKVAYYSNSVSIIGQPVGIIFIILFTIYSMENGVELERQMFFILVMIRFLPLVQNIQALKADIKGNLSSVNELLKIVDELSDNKTSEGVKNIKTPIDLSIKDLEVYSDVRLFSGLSNDFKPGNMYFIKGPSGAGKSTLIECIAGLRQSYKGKILINKVEAANYSKRTLKKHIAYVPQEGPFFRGTVRENICMFDGEISDEQIDEALYILGYTEYFKRNDLQLNRELSDHGSGLSGGQKQRISIVRAILEKPSILLLDEATSALDRKAEIATVEKLKKYSVSSKCIIILISHTEYDSTENLIDIGQYI